jgi:hypothetical protein
MNHWSSTGTGAKRTLRRSDPAELALEQWRSGFHPRGLADESGDDEDDSVFVSGFFVSPSFLPSGEAAFLVWLFP